MENCLYNGERICAYDTKNKYGIYNFKTVEDWRIAGQSGKLFCEECGSPVFLRAGEIKVPHFAHHSDQARDCYYEHIKESEEHRLGKFILYQYIKELYPDSNVQVNFRFENKRWADILVKFSDERLIVIEYQRKDVKALEWKERHEHYIRLGIPDIWILSSSDYAKGKEGRQDKMNFFEELVLTRGNTDELYFLDTDKKRFIIVKKMEYRDRNDIIREKRLFSKAYDMECVIIDKEGKIKCNFVSLFEEEYKRFKEEIRIKEEEEKEREKQRIKRLQKMWQKEPTQLPSYMPTTPTTLQNYKRPFLMEETSFEELKKEALKAKERNPEGPWYDRTRDEKWGICLICGEFTKKWYYFDGSNNTCKCKKCRGR